MIIIFSLSSQPEMLQRVTCALIQFMESLLSIHRIWMACASILMKKIKLICIYRRVKRPIIPQMPVVWHLSTLRYPKQ